MQVDLNADLGEGFGRWTLGDDEALLDIITSANVACGFHAGDPLIMRRVCELAAARGVVIGAQVGYRDLVGFGRRRIDIAPAELAADVLYQLGALEACARAAGARVGYVKPHGALYNTVAVDGAQAAAVLEAVSAFDPNLPVLTLPGSMLATLADDRGIRAVSEAFADRAYLTDGSLAPRSIANAVLHDSQAIAARAISIVRDRTLTAIDGTSIGIVAESVCLHGDTAGAVENAQAVRKSLLDAGIELGAFT
ncbi:LamB/YcsF family protein [Jatrophihabitans sp. DSM 45814]